MAYDLDKLTKDVSIAMVGKYTDLSDAYLSVIKSLQHAAMKVRRKLSINWIEASHLEDYWQSKNSDEYKSAWQGVKDSDGILVPGGFGDRGVEGKSMPLNMLEKTISRISVFAWAFKLQQLNSVVMS